MLSGAISRCAMAGGGGRFIVELTYLRQRGATLSRRRRAVGSQRSLRWAVIANAVFGVRMYVLPMTPACMLAALKARSGGVLLGECPRERLSTRLS